ncbi:MAG: cation diffusion facilitator family transporter [Oscillospiraceae bacterium]
MTKFLMRIFIKNNENIDDPNVRQKYGFLGGIVGIICNVILAMLKFIAGFLSSSIAIAADAFNNLTDAASSTVSVIGFKMAGMPPDDDHPFGHGRAEYVSGLIVSMAILITGFELIKTSVQKIFTPQLSDINEFNYIAFFIMLGSIFVKLWLFVFNKKMAKKINSPTMKATAIDSLSDVVVTSTVIIGMLITKFTNINVDAYSGAIVAIFILYAGFSTAKDTLNPLLGQPPSPEFVDDIEKMVMSYEYVLGVHDLIVHNYGANLTLISLHAEVPCDGEILVMHDMIDVIERDIKKEFNCDAVIHMDPIVTDDTVSQQMCEKISALVRLIDKSINVHDFRMVEGTTHTNLIFDVVVPHKFRLSDDEIVTAISETVKTIDPTYNVVINVDKTYLSKQ